MAGSNENPNGVARRLRQEGRRRHDYANEEERNPAVIHRRIRAKLAGTAERPRLNIYRSMNHIYAQVIDDQKGETLVSASSIALKLKTGGNVAAAKEIGKAVAERRWPMESRRSSSIAAAIFITGA